MKECLLLPRASTLPFFHGKKRLILIAGPTAIGKTSLSMKLAEIIGGEIISVDALQVYRGMDIGTAKASLQERQRIPHHLIDICSLGDSFSMLRFFQEARRACENILAKGKVPILVGGAGFYFKSFVYGPPEGPPPHEELRESLEQEWESLGAVCLYGRLTEKDPLYAKTLTSRDKQKIIRGLEIMAVTGRPVSDFSWTRRGFLKDYDLQCWCLQQESEELKEKVWKRCQQMIDRAFIDEVKALRFHGLEQNKSASKAIGYRHALTYLNSEQDQLSWDTFKETFLRDSWRYVKRQKTWFQKEKYFEPLPIKEALQRILDRYLQP